MRRQLNVPLLLGSLAVLVSVVVVGKFWHDHKKLQLANVFLQRAEVLESEQQWSKAMTYLQRYLWIKPEDFDKRLQMIDVFEKGMKTPRDRSRFSAMLYEAIGLSSQDTEIDLRMRLSKNLLQLRDYLRAEQEARIVETAAQEGSTKQAEAKRLVALSLYPRARDFAGISNTTATANSFASEGDAWADKASGVSVGSAAKALADSLEDFPSDVELATVTANFYRMHQSTLNSERLDAAKYADSVMERLLAKRGEDPEALVSVYRYRKLYKLANADQHLTKALELDPRNHAALLLSAQASAQSVDSPEKALEAASDKLSKAIEVRPKDSQAYVLLARLMARAGKLDDSIRTLQDGKQLVGKSDLALGRELTLKLLEAKQFLEAEKALGELEKALQNNLLRLTAASRRETENLLRVLRSKLSIQKGDLRDALVILKAVVATTEQDTSTTVTSAAIEARSLLGILNEQLGYWDLAASNWSGLTVDAPHLGEAHRRAALAYLKIRQPGKAVNHLEQYLKPTTPTSWSPQDSAWLALLQAHLQLQLKRSSYSQNWAEFLATLEQVKLLLPGKWETIFAEADYLNGLATPESREQAFQLLKSAEDSYASSPVFWRSLVQAYSNLNLPVEAERALDEYTMLEPDPIKCGIMRANLLARNEKYDQAEATFVGLLPTVSSEAKQKIQVQRLRILLAAGQADMAKELIQELITDQPDDPQLLSVGIETMLNAGKFAAAQKWEKQLQSLDLPDGFLWRYFRARRFLSQYKTLSDDERSELGQLISSLRSSRPGWYNVIGLAAHHAELRGDYRQAIDNYELAIKLGDDSTEMLKRLVLLLNNQGRFSDADTYLNRLSSKQAGTLQVESLEIKSAIRNNQVQEAIELARKAVDRHPDDPQRSVWLASLLALDQQTDLAESTFREALVKFPKDIRLWNGLFTLLAKSQQLDKASTVLETLVNTVEAEPTKRHFALAQGYLQLGDQERASSECQLALEIDASHVPCRLLYAKLLLTTDIPQAEQQLAKILEQDANNGEAKLQLASIWVASGRPADNDRAMELLNTIEAESPLEHQASNRLRAMLLSRQGRSQRERQTNIAAARRVMEEQLKRSDPVVDVDRVLLARIYEAEALLRGDLSALQASREQWQLLNDRSKPVVQYQLQYLEFLFRQLSRAPEDDLELAEWKSLKGVFLADAEAKVSELEDSLSGDSQSNSQLKLISYRIRLKKIQGDVASAREILDEYTKYSLPEVEEKIGKARAYLGVGNLYASLEQHEQAAEWYRKLTDIAPETYILLVRELAAQGQLNEAIDVCLANQDESKASPTNVAAVLAQLMSTADQDPEAEQRVQPIIDAALEAHQDDVNLLLAVAVLKVTKGQDDAAIKHFQQVLNLVPEHSLALNNLATLLSERPNQLFEALNYIEQAIQISGRQPALLDTLGTIQIRTGEFEKAVASLEEAVAVGKGDARYHFHLAVAYQKTGQLEESRNALRRARRSGLAKMILTQGDQQLLEFLEQQHESNNT